MTPLISLKSDCIHAMKNCISNCEELIEAYKEYEEMSECIRLCELCIHGCQDCIAACESIQADSDQFMLVVDICNACLANFENYVQVEFKKSAKACKR